MEGGSTKKFQERKKYIKKERNTKTKCFGFMNKKKVCVWIFGRWSFRCVCLYLKVHEFLVFGMNGLVKFISGASCGAFIVILEYKAERYGKVLSLMEELVRLVCSLMQVY